MKIYSETSLDIFCPWAGAKSTYDEIQEAGKLDELEAILEDLYPDGMSDTDLNDLLWFEPELVYEWLGMSNPDEDE